MTTYRTTLILAGVLSMAIGADAASPAEQPDRSRVWLGRPWAIRYVLFVDSDHGLNIQIKVSREFNGAPEKPGKRMVYLRADEMFEPTATFKVRGFDPRVLVLIEFDSAGHVISNSRRLSAFTAKRTVLDYLVLVRTDSDEEQPYYLARWSQGIPGDVSFSPAVCAGDDSSRYGDRWDRDSYAGSFGCREWTAQLYQSDRPYIDVTSYSKHGNFIGEFVGWSRFTDPPKPVIGLQGKTWLCLHDCPEGEQPGIIPNIKAWTRKHDFPMPDRPARQPEYPNSNYKDDLND
jgi:hypothetical protein